jgi:hypothetical protein
VNKKPEIEYLDALILFSDALREVVDAIATDTDIVFTPQFQSEGMDVITDQREMIHFGDITGIDGIVSLTLPCYDMTPECARVLGVQLILTALNAELP